MAQVEIPFRPDMRQAIIDGHKSCTSRNKRYGKAGDTFKIGGRTYRLTSVCKRRLGSVATFLYGQEGTDSPAAFTALWAEIHPGRGFDSFQQVWVHFFEEVRP